MPCTSPTGLQARFEGLRWSSSHCFSSGAQDGNLTKTFCNRRKKDRTSKAAGAF